MPKIEMELEEYKALERTIEDLREEIESIKLKYRAEVRTSVVEETTEFIDSLKAKIKTLEAEQDRLLKNNNEVVSLVVHERDSIKKEYQDYMQKVDTNIIPAKVRSLVSDLEEKLEKERKEIRDLKEYLEEKSEKYTKTIEDYKKKEVEIRGEYEASRQEYLKSYDTFKSDYVDTMELKYSDKFSYLTDRVSELSEELSIAQLAVKYARIFIFSLSTVSIILVSLLITIK